MLDPNLLSDDGTVSLTEFSVSECGKYLAYGISREAQTGMSFCKDIETGEDLKEDHIQWVKFSGVTWYKNGFYYSQYPEPKAGDELKGVNENNKVYYHEIGIHSRKIN